MSNNLNPGATGMVTVPGSVKERVLHIFDPTAPSHVPSFLPRIGVSKTGGAGGEDDEETRPFRGGDDVDRVMDYPNMPDPPPDCLVMHCEVPGSDDDDDEAEGNDDGVVVFPRRNAHLRGGYIFLSKPNRATAKIMCIPLAGCTVEFPPGGRRVFREHAHTGARAGYEMAIHVKTAEAGDGNKMTCFIVLNSLGHRDIWAGAIRLRCDVGNKVTALRPAGSRFDGGSIGGKPGPGTSLDEPHPEKSPIQIGGSTTAGARPGLSAKKHWGQLRSAVTLQAAVRKAEKPGGTAAVSGNADLDAAIEQFGRPGFDEDEWVHQFLQSNSVHDLSGECDKLEKWMDVIKNGLRETVLEQYEYFVEASREMSTMGREVAWLRTLVERQQETLMSMKNIDFGAGLEEVEETGEDEEYGYLSEEEGLLDDGANDNGSDASSVVSSSSEEGVSNSSTSARTPMKSHLRNRRRGLRKKTGNISLTTTTEEGDPSSPMPPQGGSSSSGIDQPPSYIEIPPWISDVTEEISAFIKESRYTDATDLILKAKAEVSEILSSHEQPTPPMVTTPTNSHHTNSSAPSVSSSSSSNTNIINSPQKKLHKKQQSLLQRTAVEIDALMDRMSKRLAENLRRKNEALKASAKRERADPLSTLAPLASPVCLNDDVVALHLLVKLGRHQEAATAYAARRSLLLSECLHERPISSPVGMDAVIYAAQLSSSFFSSLAMAVEGFLDLFLDSDTGKSGSDDDTSLNSRSHFLGGGKRVPSGALSAIVLWCDSELSKFTNVFGSSRLLGSLALSPPGVRKQEDKTDGKDSPLKEREHAIEVAAKCVDQAFLFSSENLDSIGLPLTPKLAENMRSRLKGCEAEIGAALNSRWKSLAFEWVVDSTIPERRAPSRANNSRSSTSYDDRRV